MREYRSVRVLLVEDNPDDVEILLRALERGGVPCRLTLARDGQEALDALVGEGNGGPLRVLPDLVLLDLNTPRVGGLEVLRRIRAAPQTASLPVLILTVSDREEDVRQSYEMGANTYLQKPAEFADFVHLLEVLGEYWFALAALPPRAA
jgi:CheY-like chemotaxis protein